MKIKKIVDICRGSGRITLMNDEAGRQWLSDGVGCYPLLDAPLFDEESLYATFDITEKQQENIKKIVEKIYHEDIFSFCVFRYCGYDGDESQEKDVCSL